MTEIARNIVLPKKKTEIKKDIGSMNTFLYGMPKVGKSSFASKIPNALFLATEDGHNFLEVYRIRISKWADVYEVGKLLRADDHQYKTIVVDVVDYFYKMCSKHVCNLHGVKHESDLPFGKGYSLVKDEFTNIVNGINAMGFGMCFISHAKEREITKTGSKYTVMGTSLGQTTENFITSICDFIFYAYIDDEGFRKIRTKPSKYVIAGDRTGRLPKDMEFEYSAVESFLNEGETK